MTCQVLHGDCTEVLKTFEDESIDSVVTDPPYFISVLGRDWDEEPEDKSQVTAFHFKWAKEAFRVLRPGAYLLAFNAPRTVHRMVCGIEDAGFDIRDQLCWIHPQGIPKSQDAAKAIDRLFFEEWLAEVGASFSQKEARALVSDYIQGRVGSKLLLELEQKHGLPPWGIPQEKPDGTVSPAHPLAISHTGKGTALKAVWEPIVMARKPFTGTLAQQLLKTGTGALNIDSSRVPTTDSYVINRFSSGAKPFGGAKGEAYAPVTPSAGRYPSNILASEGGSKESDVVYTESDSNPKGGLLGGYTKFFVIPKPSSKEKDEGLAGENTHPTVKPISLMRHLVRMVTPKGGTCLDPFAGSGTTGVACIDEERSFVGVELNDVHFGEATSRIRHRETNHNRSVEGLMNLFPEE